MNAYGFVGRAIYHGPENQLPLMFTTTGGVSVRIGFIYVDPMGWPRVEVDRWFLT